MTVQTWEPEMPGVRFFCDPEIAAVDRQAKALGDVQLLATLPSLTEISVYPDVIDDALGVGVPVGVCFRTSGPDAWVLPNGVTDANDGYRLVRVHADVREVEPAAGRILAALDGLRSPLASLDDAGAESILTSGLASSFLSDMTEAETARVWQGGSVGVDDPRSIGADAFTTLRHTFGSFGRYGHFAEILAVDAVLDDALPLDAGDVVLVIHGGAMEVSDIVYWNAYFEFAATALELGLVDDEQFVAGLFGLPRSHPVAARFLDAAAAVTNAAYAWRHVVQNRIGAILSAELGRSVELSLLCDLPHNRVESDGDGVLHAKGVQPLGSFGPADPAIICGGLGIHSYLVLPGEQAFLGCSHGASHSEQSGPVAAEALAAARSAASVVTDSSQRPPTGTARRQAARNIEETISSLERVHAVRRGARLRPLVNLAGHAKGRLRLDLPGVEIVRELIVSEPISIDRGEVIPNGHVGLWTGGPAGGAADAAPRHAGGKERSSDADQGEVIQGMPGGVDPARQLPIIRSRR